MSELPSWVNEYVGLPWKELGRDRDGIDCWGLFRLVLKEQFQCDLPSYDGIGFVSGSGRETEEKLGSFMTGELNAWRRVEEGRAGDGVLLRIKGHPIHVGVVIAQGSMLHIDRAIDSVIESYDSLQWKRRFLGTYRHQSLF